MLSRILLTTLVLIATVSLRAQDIAVRGSGEFEIYDRSYVTPELKRKPGVSIGFNIAERVPVYKFFEDPNLGFQISYNQMYMRKPHLRRKQNKYGKERFQFGWGTRLNLDFSTTGNISGSIHSYFYRPIFRLNLILFRMMLLNEIGVGIGWGPSQEAGKNSHVGLMAMAEPIRLQLLTLPVFFTASTHWSLSNNVFSKDPFTVGFLLGARIYFYGY